MTDEKPETVEETEKVADKAADTVEDTPEVASKPEPEIPHKSEDEIPAWGKSLISRVEDLATKVSEPVSESVPDMPDDGEPVHDETPVKPPFHKRPVSSFFGF